MDRGMALTVTGSLVVAIAAVVAYVYPQGSGRDEISVAAGRRLGHLQQALREFARTHGAFPKEGEGLGALVREGLLEESLLVDPGGRPYAYSCATPECLDVKVSSPAGPDGRIMSTSLTNRPPSPNQRELEVLEQASVRDRLAFRVYADRVLNDFFQENVMVKCISVPYDKTPFVLAFVLDDSGAVTKTLLNRDTTLGKCLVDGVSRTTFPRPPKAPFVAYYDWIKLN